ncbi:MAG: MarR family transcriptional regulator [Acetivibrio sp.]
MSKVRQLTNEFLSIMYRMRMLNKKGHGSKEVPPAEFCMILAIEKSMQRMKDSTKPGITISEMVEEMGTSLPAGSKLLRSIEKKGLIERIVNEKDRRVTYLRLSQKGHEILEKQIAARDFMMEGIVSKMGEDNMKMLLLQMQNLYTILKEEMEEKGRDV